METYKIRLPNGAVTERELEKDEVEYWLSVAMFVSHGFHLMSTIFAAEQMDDAATVLAEEESDEKEATIN